ncbi:MAG: hypothetical protein M0041_07360 [Nitrospiraceae bacterium]|nr:hypothetical protein [Nitrospiraceae bacterium]
MGCSSSIWNNPHGLLGGLFGGSSEARTGQQNSTSYTRASTASSSTPPDRPGNGFSSISPPKFIHIVPFEEGDGFYLQWTRVAGATDYLLFRHGALVADVPQNVYEMHGLLPCRSYRFFIWSSNGAVLSKKPLKVHARTLGCLRTR